jgi:hypothetical protein
MAAIAPGWRGLQVPERAGQTWPAPVLRAPVIVQAADPLLVARRHVDFLRIGSALCLPRPLTQPVIPDGRVPRAASLDPVIED